MTARPASAQSPGATGPTGPTGPAPLLRALTPANLAGGALHGVGPQSLVCSLAVGQASADLGAWQAWLDQWVVDPSPPPAAAPQAVGPAGPQEPPHGPEVLPVPPVPLMHLMHLVHRWYSALQREQNIMVFGPCAVLPQAVDAQAQAQARRCTLLLPWAQADAARATLDWVLMAVNRLAEGDAAARDDLPATLTALRARLQPQGLASTNMVHFVAAAHALGLPINPIAPSIYAIGHGGGSRWLQSSLTDRTPGIGVALARHKYQTAGVLRRAGLPVPRHLPAPSEDRAVQAALQLGYPVVVKPADQDQGRGVFTHIQTEDDLRRCWQAARVFSPQVLVEVCHAGHDYRLTVAHGRVVKVIMRRPAAVEGDGTTTVAALVAALQQRPDLLNAFRRTGQQRLQLDAEALELLAEQGLTAESVPPAGQRVVLRRKANYSTGGSVHLLQLPQVHPDNLALVVRATALLRLDIAGIDLISPDAGQPWHTNGAVICEVNAQPQLGDREMRQLYPQLLQEMMLDYTAPRFTALLVEADLQQPVAQVAQALGCNAWTSREGAWIDGRQIAWGQTHSVAAATTLLAEAGLQHALLVLHAADVLREGLPVMRLDAMALPATVPGQPLSRLMASALQACAAHAQRVIHIDLPAHTGPGQPERKYL